MGGKKKREDYDYVSVEIIKRACRGDGDALSRVISRYQNYGRKCLRAMAAEQGIDTRNLPFDDLMQDVWIEVVRVIVEKFKA